MIRLDNVWKSFRVDGHLTHVVRGASATFPTGKSVALLGRNGSGKSVMMKLIAGTMHPDRGTVTSTGSVSWPVGFAGSFHREMTATQNIRFIARAYGADSEELIAFTREFADLGAHFDLPIRTYSSGMRSRLAFGVSMGIRFDTYLVDEVTSVGDRDFKDKARDLFYDRMRQSGAIVVSHSKRMIKDLCEAGVVLDQGQLTYYHDLDEAIAHHDWLIDNLPREQA
nr:ABC transporter ATP-binding protein [uncultured Celeribacter sp.]